MTTHILKIDWRYAIEVSCGFKTFELRKNDRDFHFGDRVKFKVINSPLVKGIAVSKMSDKDIKEFESKTFIITYVLKNVPQFGLNKDYAIISLCDENDFFAFKVDDL